MILSYVLKVFCQLFSQGNKKRYFFCPKTYPCYNICMERYLKIQTLAKNEINRVNNELVQKLNLSEPLLSQMRSFLSAPAKRIRPILTILYIKACEHTLTENHYKLLTAIELVHNASLIHDDVIDDADLRRNKKTLNTEFNPKLAVVAGDYLLSCALEYIQEINIPQILINFTNTLSEMCNGEFSQYFAANKIPSMNEYLIKTEQKTAKLFMTALECSMILSNLPPENAREFAYNFGMTFQIKDDLTNILTTKTDIENGIFTAPIILSGQINTPAIEKTYDLLNNYINNAIKNLNKLNENKYQKALLELMEIYRR